MLTYAQNVLSNMLLHTIANQKYSQLFKQQENRTDFNQTAGGADLIQRKRKIVFVPSIRFHLSNKCDMNLDRLSVIGRE